MCHWFPLSRMCAPTTSRRRCVVLTSQGQQGHKDTSIVAESQAAQNDCAHLVHRARSRCRNQRFRFPCYAQPVHLPCSTYFRGEVPGFPAQPEHNRGGKGYSTSTLFKPAPATEMCGVCCSLTLRSLPSGCPTRRRCSVLWCQRSPRPCMQARIFRDPAVRLFG